VRSSKKRVVHQTKPVVYCVEHCAGKTCSRLDPSVGVTLGVKNLLDMRRISLSRSAHNHPSCDKKFFFFFMWLAPFVKKGDDNGGALPTDEAAGTHNPFPVLQCLLTGLAVWLKLCGGPEEIHSCCPRVAQIRGFSN